MHRHAELVRSQLTIHVDVGEIPGRGGGGMGGSEMSKHEEEDWRGMLTRSEPAKRVSVQ